MTHHIALFQFRLSHGQSIGPTVLRRLWASACSTTDVTVRRELRRAGLGAESHTYSLCGSPRTAGLPEIEARLRKLLDTSVAGATATLVRTL